MTPSACAADHVINSSPSNSASVFPPPHLIITRNAHGAEARGGRRPGNEATPHVTNHPRR